jgi:hypothetical protein
MKLLVHDGDELRERYEVMAYTSIDDEDMLFIEQKILSAHQMISLKNLK